MKSLITSINFPHHQCIVMATPEPICTISTLVNAVKLEEDTFQLSSIRGNLYQCCLHTPRIFTPLLLMN